jgi:hypothetical protein
MVQKEPAPPVYDEHSFVIWSFPLRPDAVTGDAPGPSQSVRTTRPESQEKQAQSDYKYFS